MSDVKVSKPMVTDIFVEGAKKKAGLLRQHQPCLTFLWRLSSLRRCRLLARWI